MNHFGYYIKNIGIAGDVESKKMGEGCNFIIAKADKVLYVLGMFFSFVESFNDSLTFC